MLNIEEQIKNENLDLFIPVLKGGEEIFKFFEENGFVIKRKNQISKLISNYKKHINTTQLKDELYKWELVNKFKNKPDVNKLDFLAEVKEIKYGNLLYAMALPVLYHLTHVATE